MSDLLAKSDGISLTLHSNMVSDVSLFIYDIISNNREEKIRESIRIASLLHDIGKSTESFQERLKENPNPEEIENKKYPWAHNEIGYYFLYNFLKNPNNKFDRNLVLDLVYWHHGVNPQNFKGDNYKNPISINDSDLNRMKDFLVSILGEDYLRSGEFYIEPISKRPPYYRNESFNFNDDCRNEELIICRGCLISSDRMVSSGVFNGLNRSEISERIKSVNTLSKKIRISDHKYSGSERFENQISISHSVIKNNSEGKRTHILKAPAGFGKTLTGLLWGLESGKRIIWVCPRNDVANSVYRTIKEELTGFIEGNNISVELYLSGDVIEKTHEETSSFGSDIIVTNIDNFINPTSDNRYSGRIFTILESNVIFDEFHEFVCDNPIFSLFVRIMRARHNLTNSNSLLLSATPGLVNFLWDNEGNNTVIFPDLNNHYTAQHDKEYLLNVEDNIPIIEENSSSVIIFNSVKNSQIYKRNSGIKLLYHSNYTRSDRERIINEIYSKFSKGSKRSESNENVTATHVLQASLDISFLNLFESVLSPESTLQRIGRCDRFGDYNKKCTVNIFGEFSDPSERMVRDLLYKKDLTLRWFNFIKDLSGKEINLDSLYSYYNKFIIDNKREIMDFVMRQCNLSLSNLSKVFPIKILSKKKGVKKAGGNKLRSVNGNEVFVIAKFYDDPRKYSDPISVDTYNDFDSTFNESTNHRERMIKNMEIISEQGDARFDYSPIIGQKQKKERTTLDLIRTYAKFETTPYIRFDKVYHPDYGFVDEKILN